MFRLEDPPQSGQFPAWSDVNQGAVASVTTRPMSFAWHNMVHNLSPAIHGRYMSVFYSAPCNLNLTGS